MDIMNLFKRTPIAPAANTPAISREAAAELWEMAEEKIREAHLQLTRLGTHRGQWVSHRGPRTEGGKPDLAVIYVELVHVQELLDTVAVIAAELERDSSGFYHAVNVPADLTAVEVFATPEPTVLTSCCSILLRHTTIGRNIYLRLVGKVIHLDIQEGTRFEALLGLWIGSDTSVDLQMTAPRFDSAINICGEDKSSLERSTFYVRASGVVFTKNFELAEVHDISDIDLTGAEFQGAFAMRQCRSNGHSSFVGAQFHKNAHFERCVFAHPPDLHNAAYRMHLNFEECRFIAAGATFGSACEARDVDAYRVLRGHFAKLRNSRLEGVFFAHEQRGDRILHHQDLIDRSLSWCYDLLSGYGQSTSRIAGWFIAWNSAFATLYNTALRTALHAPRPPFSDWLGLSFTLQNTFNPLALFSEKNVVTVDSMLCFLLALVQTLGSLAIVTVFLLTVRTRFRRGGTGSES